MTNYGQSNHLSQIVAIQIDQSNGQLEIFLNAKHLVSNKLLVVPNREIMKTRSRLFIESI